MLQKESISLIVSCGTWPTPKSKVFGIIISIIIWLVWKHWQTVSGKLWARLRTLKIWPKLQTRWQLERQRQVYRWKRSPTIRRFCSYPIESSLPAVTIFQIVSFSRGSECFSIPSPISIDSFLDRGIPTGRSGHLLRIGSIRVLSSTSQTSVSKVGLPRLSIGSMTENPYSCMCVVPKLRTCVHRKLMRTIAITSTSTHTLQKDTQQWTENAFKIAFTPNHYHPWSGCLPILHLRLFKSSYTSFLSLSKA